MSIIYINSYQFATPAGPALLLDAYPGAAAAYSLRQLRTGVTTVVRVRRSSDNAEQDFTAAQIADGTLTAFCGASNGFVQTWYDQSGNDQHASQTTQKSQPAIVLSGSLITQNGKPALRTDGSNDFLQRTNFSVNGFLFFAARGGTGSTQETYQGLTDSLVITNNSSTPKWSLRKTDDASVAADTAVPYNTRALVSLRTLANDCSIWVNSIQRATDLTTNAYPSTDIRIFVRSTTYFSGDTHELIIYNTDQSANRTAIEANINAHYGIF